MDTTRKPKSWDGFFAARAKADGPDDILDERERDQGSQDRDPFAGWNEDEPEVEPFNRWDERLP